MKKYLALVLTLLLLLTGCSGGNRELTKAMALRQELMKSRSCSFEAKITADYGDAIHTFKVSCEGDKEGSISFTVTEPETISGIRGTISNTGGQLTYADTVLQFDLLMDGQLSPVSGPWIFLRTLREGYLLNAGPEEDKIHVQAKDSYDEGALLVDFWLDENNLPLRSEVLYRGRKILTVELENFRLVPDKQV